MPATKVIKPLTPGQRGMIRPTFEELTGDAPQKSLLVPRPRKAGRNSQGKITVRHWGGGHKRQLRLIDFKRNKHGVPGRVASIEYDPNRSARLALVQYVDGEKRYILYPIGLQVGSRIESGPSAPLQNGNALPLKSIPTGMSVHNVELQPGRGGQIVRSAGTSAQVMSRDGRYTQVRLPSGEVRRVFEECYATLGQVGNEEHKNLKLGKAGKRRHLGRRPHVRGSAMTPRDHPHGGGEGRSPIGMPGPKTPWGQPALGKKTRRNKRTNTFIVRRRK